MSSRTVQGYGDSFYWLAKADDTITPDYTMCSLRSFLFPDCSTHYNVTGASSAFLASHCEDPLDIDSYISSQPTAPVAYQFDWTDVGLGWALAVGLDDGKVSGNASNARLLTQFITGKPKLPMLTPSLAEALAVEAGWALVQSSLKSPFVHYWDYQANVLDPGVYQAFNASIQSQQYTSGYIEPWQGSFYIVLLLVCAINVFCLVYLILRRGLVTDFTEGQNLFALAINSPASSAMAGTCGAGPEGKDLGVAWGICRQDDGHYFVSEKESVAVTTGFDHQRSKIWKRSYKGKSRAATLGLGILGRGNGMAKLKTGNSYEMLSNKTRSWL